MPHIHTEPGQHDLVVEAYIMRTDFDQPKMMLHLHKKMNVWLQFGGHVELDENPWEAVTHEIREESGYDLKQLKILQPKSRLLRIEGAKLHFMPININTHPVSDTHSHISIGYAFVTDQKPAHELMEGESYQIKLVSKKELLDIPEAQLFPGTRDACLFIFDECWPNWEQIPATS